MGPLPDTVQPLEVVWTLLSAVAAASSWGGWVWARSDLAFVRTHGRRHLERAFVEDARNALWRLFLALAILAAGAVAMTQPSPPARRTPSGWIIVALLFVAPVQIIVRNRSERLARLQTVREVGTEPPRNGDQL